MAEVSTGICGQLETMWQIWLDPEKLNRSALSQFSAVTALRRAVNDLLVHRHLSA